MTTIIELRKQLIDTLNRNKDDILSACYVEDRIIEFIDDITPTYYIDLLDVVRNDYAMSRIVLPSAVSDFTTIFDIIEQTVKADLNTLAHLWLESCHESEFY